MTILFHSEDDLVEVRPNILLYGVTDFEAQMQKSEDIINRVLESRWYRAKATDQKINFESTVFDPALLLNADGQLKTLAVYKSLQLIYLHLMKETPEEDGFERQMGTFKKLYAEELAEVLASGLDYDWDDSGTIEAGENIQPQIRRLQRV